MNILTLKGTEKTVEHENDVYTYYNRCSLYIHQRINKGTGGLGNKRERVEIIKTISLLSRVLEIWGDLLLLRLQWKTIS